MSSPTSTPNRKRMVIYRVKVPEGLTSDYHADVENGEVTRVNHGAAVAFDFDAPAQDWHATFFALDHYADVGPGEFAAIIAFEHRPNPKLLARLRPLLGMLFDFAVTRVLRRR